MSKKITTPLTTRANVQAACRSMRAQLPARTRLTVYQDRRSTHTRYKFKDNETVRTALNHYVGAAYVEAYTAPRTAISPVRHWLVVRVPNLDTTPRTRSVSTPRIKDGPAYPAES